MKRIVQIKRKSTIKTKSIENLFNVLNKEIVKRVDVDEYELKYGEGDYFYRIRNIIDVMSIRRRSSAFHIVGDCYYVALALFGKKLVCTYHDLIVIKRYGFIKKLIFEIFWVEVPKLLSNKLTFVSKESFNEYSSNYKLNGSKAVVIQNCLTLSSGVSGYKSYKKIRENKSFVILTVGTKSNKNIMRIGQACSRMENIDMLIVGDKTDEVEKLLTNSLVNAIFVGRVSDNELFEIYKKSDLLVFASIEEGFGLPILEAQAVGLAVITSNVSSMPEVAGEGALYCNPLDVDDIANKIRLVMNDELFRNRLIELGYRNVQNFLPSRKADEYIKVYEDLLT